jgi:hypothetical protein
MTRLMIISTTSARRRPGRRRPRRSCGELVLAGEVLFAAVHTDVVDDGHGVPSSEARIATSALCRWTWVACAARSASLAATADAISRCSATDAARRRGCRARAGGPGRGGAHRLEGRGQVVVGDGGVEGVVEAGDERVVGVGVGGGIRPRELTGQRSEQIGIGAACGEARSRLLEGAAHLEQLADVAGVDVADHGEPRRRLHDEAVGEQAPQRFAQRRAAHPGARTARLRRAPLRRQTPDWISSSSAR